MAKAGGCCSNRVRWSWSAAKISMSDCTWAAAAAPDALASATAAVSLLACQTGQGSASQLTSQHLQTGQQWTLLQDGTIVVFSCSEHRTSLRMAALSSLLCRHMPDHFVSSSFRSVL